MESSVPDPHPSNSKRVQMNSAIIKEKNTLPTMPSYSSGLSLLQISAESPLPLYCWSDRSYQCCHNIPDSDRLLAELSINSKCAALAYIHGMYYNASLGVIISPSHRTCLPWADFSSFIQRRCSSVYHLLQKDSLFDSILRHIQTTFELSITQTVETVMETANALIIASAIPGLPTPELALRCPGCKRWYNATGINRSWRSGMRRHWTSPNCPSKPSQIEQDNYQWDLERRWTIPLFTGLRGNSASPDRLVLSEEYDPGITSASPFSDSSMTPQVRYAEPQWAHVLGWSDYLESLGAEPSALNQLIGLPSVQTYKIWPEESEGRRIEQALYLIHNSLKTYLEHANNLVSNSHPSLRSAITAGCVLCGYF